MKILAMEKEIVGVTDDQFTPALLQQEAKRAWELYQKGVIRELYFRQDKPEAILILECKDLNEASSMIDTLPLVKYGLISFELVPLIPYPGFARLFT
jgi:muconolactone delta-isomerase